MNGYIKWVYLTENNMDGFSVNTWDTCIFVNPDNFTPR